jgi:iron complex outermembrane receptor protein
VIYEDTSFRVGLEYDLAPDSLVYANVSSAFKAGGFFIGLAPNTYEPEKLTAYQIGTKNRFFNRRVQANIELFYWDYKDQQIAVFSALNPPQLTATRPFNVPGWIYGADMDFAWLVTDHDRLNLQVLYAKGEYETFPTAASEGRITGGLTDAPRANLPEFSATLGYERTWDLNNGAVITFGARTHYETATYLNPNRTAGSRRDAYFTSDLDLTFEAPNADWKITAFARNLENADIALTGTSGIIGPGIAFRPAGNTNSPYVGLAPPRTYGVRVSKSFYSKCAKRLKTNTACRCVGMPMTICLSRTASAWGAGSVATSGSIRSVAESGRGLRRRDRSIARFSTMLIRRALGCRMTPRRL